MIKGINLRNIYSFGDGGTPELMDFSKYNLFIGKNGSGKTTVFRAFSNLELKVKYKKPYLISLSENIFNKSIHKFNGGRNPQQEKERHRDIKITLELDTINFKNSKHIEGDYSNLQKSVEHFELNRSFEELKIKLLKLSVYKNREILLSFALDFIFGVPIKIQDASIGEFVNGDLNSGGRHIDTGRSAEIGVTGKQGLNSCEWTSGYTAVTNILSQFLISRKNIFCFDELEMNLEPRVIRNFVSILMWLSSTYDQNHMVSQKWLIWINKFKKCFQLDEKKKDYYIKLLKTNIFKNKQIFIASHSSVLINEFLRHKDQCAIYEFNQRKEENTWINPGRTGELGSGSRKSHPMVSVVRKAPLDNYPTAILDNLGARGSDLLQTNGVIWVEGPSDVIYIKKWLDMYVLENKKKQLFQGSDYEFQMYGGTILDSLALIKGDPSVSKEEYKKLVEMFSFSRNTFVVIDSDAVKNSNGLIIDKSKFIKAKKYIKTQFEKLSVENRNLGIWFKEGNSEIKTIEDYLDEESKKMIKSSWTKKITSQNLTNAWKKSKKLSDFPNNLKDEIEILYELITRWNE